MKTINALCVCLAGAAVLGCGKGDERGPGFEIAVAPLELPDITDACYRVTVTNGPGRTGEIVWQQDRLCADDFGNGLGAISYVGTCDASVTVPNSVTLELLDVSTGEPARALGDSLYVNPCGEIADWDGDRDALLGGEDAGPCTIDKVCEENADVAVVFDLTIMRNAVQGFFDFAVNFGDIFCSAKLDCKDALLHDADGERAETAVVAFACSAGVDQVTRLHLSDLTLSCDVDGDPETPAPFVFTLANGGGEPVEGQHGAVTTSGGQAGVFQWASYANDEQLGLGNPGERTVVGVCHAEVGDRTGTCVYDGVPDPQRRCISDAQCNARVEVLEPEPFAKCYWNRAVGIDVAALTALGVTSCTLSGIGTATDSDLDLGAAGSWYPVVAWEVEVFSRDPAGGVSLCENNALNDVGSGVQTTYVSATSAPLQPFTGEMRCELPGRVECAAGPLVDGGDAAVEVTQVGPQLNVTTNGQSTVVPLTGALAGFKLAGSCYQDVCCQE